MKEMRWLSNLLKIMQLSTGAFGLRVHASNHHTRIHDSRPELQVGRTQDRCVLKDEAGDIDRCKKFGALEASRRK